MTYNGQSNGIENGFGSISWQKTWFQEYFHATTLQKFINLKMKNRDCLHSYAHWQCMLKSHHENNGDLGINGIGNIKQKI